MTPPRETSPLLVASRDGDDPSALTFGRATDAGRLVRLRQGVYLDALAWVQSPAWERPLIAAAAQALRQPKAIFCRETALLLHGFSLLQPPSHVDVRVADNANTGRRPFRSMTGAASQRRLEDLLSAAKPSSRTRRQDLTRIFQSIPNRGFRYPGPFHPAQHSSGALPVTVRYAAGLIDIPLPELSCADVSGITLRTEPLEFVLLDTVHRLPQPAAVALIDAFRAGRHRLRSAGTEEDLNRWAEVLPSMRARSRTRRAWDLSDARAENPGESFSRVLIHQLGYDPPDLQTKLTLHDGTIAYVDFMWDSAGIAGEFDGDQKYLKAASFGMTAQEAVLKEKKREDAIRRLGYRVIRWDWSSLQDPRRLDRILNEAGVPRRRRASLV
ncbi:endonuclease domain-containing protein [Nesterenkonia massiliensis]|uniref:Endonuclease domain-containing protein n=1 Tax=Nesterenkonia massiliensis TaxID=1232429 RepID=A0ABT2HMV9_9MICC|nr:endonuclease domain-containing protein [Nesterenkonia massiliensis]MCT1605885.1 endonuclease domain-containing protein [Nesterenkonia massiliensis]